MIDKSTCVFTRANGTSNGLEEHLLSMRPGTNVTIDITIICKSGGNTLYICAKWRGQEYHGVLTDGEPLFSHHHSQKRLDFELILLNPPNISLHFETFRTFFTFIKSLSHNKPNFIIN